MAVKGTVKPRAKSSKKKTSQNGTTPVQIPASVVLETLCQAHGPFPWEPRYDPGSELVFTVLTQHTNDRNAERAFVQLMDTFGSLEALLEADTDLIAQCIAVGGLAKIKAPRIKQILNLIMEKRGSLDLSFLKDLPLEDAKAWLRELPGVGPKTAGIILSFSLGMPAMAVDTHIFRVSRRLGLIGPKTSYEDAHPILEAAVQPEQVYDFHVALITHGRRVCKALKPLCDQCVLAYGCPSRVVPKEA